MMQGSARLLPKAGLYVQHPRQADSVERGGGMCGRRYLQISSVAVQYFIFASNVNYSGIMLAELSRDYFVLSAMIVLILQMQGVA